jgi:hypothetical protein
MESPAEIEIRPAGQDDAGGILKCMAAALGRYRAEYSPAAFADTVLDEATVHVSFPADACPGCDRVWQCRGNDLLGVPRRRRSFARNGSFAGVAPSGCCREITRRNRKLVERARMQTNHAGHNLAAPCHHEILLEKRLPSFGKRRRFFRHPAARIRQATLTAKSRRHPDPPDQILLLGFTLSPDRKCIQKPQR